MANFEIIYSKRIEAKDFFDAVDKAKEEDLEVLSVSSIPEDEDVFNE